MRSAVIAPLILSINIPIIRLGLAEDCISCRGVLSFVCSERVADGASPVTLVSRWRREWRGPGRVLMTHGYVGPVHLPTRINRRAVMSVEQPVVGLALVAPGYGLVRIDAAKIGSSHVAVSVRAHVRVIGPHIVYIPTIDRPVHVMPASGSTTPTLHLGDCTPRPCRLAPSSLACEVLVCGNIGTVVDGNDVHVGGDARDNVRKESPVAR